MNSTKCEYCGQFIPEKDMDDYLRNGGGPAKFVFSPDSHFTSEDSGWICKKCADEEEEFYLNGNKN